jgi:hypothetical protein
VAGISSFHVNYKYIYARVNKIASVFFSSRYEEVAHRTKRESYFLEGERNNQAGKCELEVSGIKELKARLVSHSSFNAFNSQCM